MSSTFLYAAIVVVWAVVLVPMWLRRDNDAAGFSRLLSRRSIASFDGRRGELPVDPGLVHGVDHHLDHLDQLDTDGSATATAVLRAAGDHSGSADDITGGAELDADLDAEPPYERLLDEEADLDRTQAVRRHRRNSRASVIARRRRRTFGLTALAAGVAAVAGLGLAPWWVTLPPVGLLIGHLALLRVAAGIDAARQRALRIERARLRAERERAEAEAREREEAAKAQIIDLAERARARDIFDQYAADEDLEERDGQGKGDLRAVGD